MGLLFVYILKSSVGLIILYLFYKLFLSKETFHRFNRVFLLSLFFISWIPALCRINIQPTEIHQTLSEWEQLLLLATDSGTVSDPVRSSFTPVHLILVAYWSGVLFFFLKSVYSLIRMGLLIRRGRKEKRGAYTLVIHDKPLPAFSWMHYIVISQNDLNGESASEIIMHESAHIRHRHSFDLLLAEICILFQWFNPAALLMKKELQHLHEYQADETVLNTGIDAKKYQLLLIKKAVGSLRFNSMANSFNHSTLKKRITMMLKEKSNPWARLKYLYILPVAAISVTLFARPEISNRLDEISAVKVNDLSIITEQKPEDNSFRTEQTVVTKENRKKNSSEEPDQELEIKFSPETGNPMITVGETTGTAEQIIINNTGSAEDSLSLPQNKKFGIHLSLDDNAPLIVVSGKKLTPEEFDRLEPEQIEEVAIMKNTETEKYGKNGIIFITLKGENSSEEKQKTPGSIEIKVTESETSQANEVKVIGYGSQKGKGIEGIFRSSNANKIGEKVTVVIDEKEFTTETDKLDEMIDTENIESIEVLKNPTQNKIIITTKKSLQ